MIIQFCGLSGSGKTTMANAVQSLLKQHGLVCDVIDQPPKKLFDFTLSHLK